MTLADGRPVPVEQLVVAHLSSLFAPFEVRAHAAFRVTRQVGLPTGPAAEDILAATELQLSRDRTGVVVRLEVEASMPDDLITRLVTDLDLGESDVYPVHGLLGLASLRQLSDLDRPELKASRPAGGHTHPAGAGERRPTRSLPGGGERRPPRPRPL